MTCAGCGRWSAKWTGWSDRLGELVCWGCLHASFTREEIAEAERVERQHEIAIAIRGAIKPLCGWRAKKLRDLALDLELTGADGDVGALLAEAQKLGVEVEP